MRCAVIAAALACWAYRCAGAQESAGPHDEIRESFNEGGWDRHYWAVDTQSPSGVRVDLSEGSLRFVIPPGPAGRPAARMRGRFLVEGDFEVQAAYRLRGFPRPLSEWLNAQVLIEGAGGPASVMRTNHAEAGPGYAMWWEPATTGTPGAWSQTPTESLEGILRLERTGETLRFLYADSRASGEAGFTEIGSVKYGSGPVSGVELSSFLPETPSVVDVSFDDVLVREERIIDPHVVPAGSRSNRSRGRIVAVASLLLLAVAAWLAWRSRRSP